MRRVADQPLDDVEIGGAGFQGAAPDIRAARADLADRGLVGDGIDGDGIDGADEGAARLGAEHHRNGIPDGDAGHVHCGNADVVISGPGEEDGVGGGRAAVQLDAAAVGDDFAGDERGKTGAEGAHGIGKFLVSGLRFLVASPAEGDGVCAVGLEGVLVGADGFPRGLRLELGDALVA